MSTAYPQRRFAAPPDAVELIVVRHGASAAAVPGRPFPDLEGRGDPPLAPEGQLQAETVMERLAAEPLEALFVTPLRRTSQTAAPLAARTGIEPVAIAELSEVGLGAWEGGELRVRAAQGDPLFRRMLQEERWDVIPGAEPMDRFAARVAAGFERMVELTGRGRRAVAFLHGGVIGEICRQVTASRPFAFIHADNCSITRIVSLATGQRLLRSFNDTAHLQDAASG